MRLPYHYYNDAVDKFVISPGEEARPSVTLNATRISSQEFDAIEAWCRARNNCTYYTAGVVVFGHSAALTEFFLRWS